MFHDFVDLHSKLPPPFRGWFASKFDLRIDTVLRGKRVGKIECKTWGTIGCKSTMKTIILFLLLILWSHASAEIVIVKYRGAVDLKPFFCERVSRSSLVTRVCYDRKERYMIINLNGIYYHYCEIDAGTVNNLLNARSMGRYYNESIKGNFDCRINRMPAYR
jgi:hypothetical protein